jgi:hypothetical protein
MRRATMLQSTVVLASLVLGQSIVLAQHAASAPPAAAPKPTATAPLSTPVTTPSSNPPDVKAVVDRIQKRIASEIGPQATRTETGVVAAPSQSRARRGVGPVRTNPARIRLEWRLSLIWPPELSD